MWVITVADWRDESVLQCITCYEKSLLWDARHTSYIDKFFVMMRESKKVQKTVKTGRMPGLDAFLTVAVRRE